MHEFWLPALLSGVVGETDKALKRCRKLKGWPVWAQKERRLAYELTDCIMQASCRPLEINSWQHECTFVLVLGLVV